MTSWKRIFLVLLKLKWHKNGEKNYFYIITLHRQGVMQFIAALRVLHLTGIIPTVLWLQIRQHELSGRQDLHVSSGIGAYLLRGTLVPISRRISDRIARQSRRPPPRTHHMPAEGRDPGWHTIRRNLRRHPRTLALAHSGATSHPELILDVLLQVGRLEICTRRR